MEGRSGLVCQKFSGKAFMPEPGRAEHPPTSAPAQPLDVPTEMGINTNTVTWESSNRRLHFHPSSSKVW